MEDNVFEIRIWANIAGFDEVKFAKNLKGLFPEKRNSNDPLGLDATLDSFQAGEAFSVYYEKDVYVVVKKILAPVEAEYRGTGVYLTVTIKRGWNLESKDFFASFEEKFYEIASKHKEVHTSKGLADNEEKLYAELKKYIKQDNLQLCYSCADRKKAVISYETPGHLYALLDNPIRPEFKDLYQLIILQKEEATKQWEFLRKLGYFAITDIQYKYQRKFKLVYPDKHEETVTGLEQEVDYECKMSGYQPYHFCGKLVEHVSEWQITLSEDKTTYTIGKSLEPLTKEYILVCKMDGRACQTSGKKKNDFLFQTNIGRIVGNKLILTGQEIGQTPTLTLQSLEYKIESQEMTSNEIIVNLKRRFYYNVKALLEDFARKNPKQQNVSAQLKDTEGKCGISVLTNSQAQGYFDVPYTRAQLHFGETDDYQAWDCFADSDGKFPQTYGAAPKPKITVQFKIQNESLIQVAESGKLRGKCFYQIGNRLSEVDITDTTFVISDLPFDKIAFTLQVKGYKDYSQTKDYSKKASDKTAVEEIEVTLFPSPRKRIFFWGVTMVVSCLLGACLCSVLLGYKMLKGDVGNDAIVDSLKIRIDSLENVNAEQKKELEELREILQTKQSSANESDKVEIKAEKDKNEVPPVDSVRQQLLEKLKGMDFTQKDIDKLNGMNPSEEEKNLIASCKACLKLVNLSLQDKSTVTNKSGTAYDIHYTKLLPVHKTFMDGILFGRYKGAYTTVNRRNFPSVNKALDAYKNEELGIQ